MTNGTGCKANSNQQEFMNVQSIGTIFVFDCIKLGALMAIFHWAPLSLNKIFIKRSLLQPYLAVVIFDSVLCTELKFI